MIRRSANGGCCEWCAALAGVYPYEEVRATGSDVYRRHRDCRCTVTYDPGDGKVQNVHTKRWEAFDGYQKELEIIANKGRNGIIKSIELDELKAAAHGKGIREEVIDYIKETMTELENSGRFVFSDIFIGRLESDENGIPVLQTEMMPNGLLKLRINVDVVSGKSINELDDLFRTSDKTVCQSFKDAMVHEAGHAKLISGKDPWEVEKLYDALLSEGDEKVSGIAGKDGAECITEVEVLLSKGEEVPEMALELYKRHIK